MLPLPWQRLSNALRKKSAPWPQGQRAWRALDPAFLPQEPCSLPFPLSTTSLHGPGLGQAFALGPRASGPGKVPPGKTPRTVPSLGCACTCHPPSLVLGNSLVNVCCSQRQWSHKDKGLGLLTFSVPNTAPGTQWIGNRQTGGLPFQKRHCSYPNEPNLTYSGERSGAAAVEAGSMGSGTHKAGPRPP